jgi:hypothetical protein
VSLPAKGDGIPEPSLIMYGVVNNLSDGSRVTFGNLSWTIQPVSGGPSITLSGILTNINDQFCYVLRVPCETEIPGIPISAGTLKLATTATSYNRALVTIGGVAATFNQPALTNLTLASTDRGRIERIDLTVNLTSTGLLPDAWQIQYFGHTGVDPYADPDGDGMNNLAEYLAGTDPTNPQSRFAIIRVQNDPSGGINIQWSSVTGKAYTLQRSPDLLGGFSDLQLHIAATAPLNSFRDTTATGRGPYFYRLRVE